MSDPLIPPFDLSAELEALWPELQAAIERVLRSGQFILGSEVEALEQELARYLGVRHAVTLNSGTDALVIGLEALGVGAGDEVVTTPFSFFATAEAISRVGAKPVFADIEPDTFNLDPDKLEALLTSRTKAVLPVHLFGLSADMERIVAFAERHELLVLEDCAQSFGARCGSRYTGGIGQAGAFSFYPTKNLGAYGDGGLLTTDDDGVAESARLLRNHGSKRRYVHERLGYTSRLDALQAAILRVKLPYVAGWNEDRRAVAERYHDLLSGTPGLTLPEPSPKHVFHQYTVRVEGGRRDAAQAFLRARGVSSTVYYPVALHQSPVYQRGQSLPQAEKASREALSLPLWPQLAAEQQRRVALALREALNPSCTPS